MLSLAKIKINIDIKKNMLMYFLCLMLRIEN